MTPMAQEVGKLAGELMTLLAFKKETATVEDFCTVITNHLTTFAQARERAVWEEAASELIKENDHYDNNGWAQAERAWSTYFSRRADLAKKRESLHAV